MFDPVIKVFMDEMKMQHEGEILKAVQNVGVFVDKDELLKALAYDRGQYEKGFADGVKEYCQRIVKELELKQEESFRLYAIAFDPKDRGEYNAYSDAIEIVKEGGLNEI